MPFTHSTIARPAASPRPAVQDEPRPARRSRRAGGPAPLRRAGANEKLALAASLLIVSLFTPWVVMVGSLAISPYRLVLVAMVVPSLVKWLGGAAGRVRVADIAVIGYGGWCVIALTVNHGVATGIQSGGILLVETWGGYFLARCLVRNADQFYQVCRLLFIMVMLLLPFAIIEWITGQNLLLRAFLAVLPGHGLYRMPARFGLQRVQSVFEHPILFGVCCTSAFALTFTVLGWKRTWARRWTTTGLAGLATTTSMSAGPLSAMIAQAGLLVWGWLLKDFAARWKLLLVLVVFGLIFIDAFSNRPLPNILLSSFALDMESAYYRVLIWDFGTQSALHHPLFGVGFGTWEHPSWMTESIDMFWLYHAIVFGIPADMLMLLAFVSALIGTGFRPGLDERLYTYRMGYLICMAGFFISGWTVHFWNATFVLFMFLMGSGMWFADAGSEAEGSRARQSANRPPRRRAGGRGRAPRPRKRASAQ